MMAILVMVTTDCTTFAQPKKIVYDYLVNRSPELPNVPTDEEVVQPEMQLKARQLHTQVYMQQGFIDHSQLDQQELFTDQYIDRSQYVYVHSAKNIATCRMIHTDKKAGGLLSLPTMQHFSINSDILRFVSDAQRPSAINPKSIVEISGLAAGRVDNVDNSHSGLSAISLLYAGALRQSLDAGHKAWVMNVEQSYRADLEDRLGEDNIHELGDEREYIGAPTIPIALNPQWVVTSLLKDDTDAGLLRKRYILEMMSGVSEKKLEPGLITLLHENGVETKPESLFSKARKQKRALLYGGIMGYSALRAAPLGVGAIPEFDGSALVFGHLDVITAGTQVMGMEAYLSGDTKLRRRLGATAAIASLYAPYAYVWANGGTNSPVVNTIAGVLTGGATAFEIRSSVIDRRLEEALFESDLPETGHN